ncbi:hypothetical protein [uncultured Bradyrhizobium sp.]|uniref:hypothetical protein n=1 Tax=uncultured Bradyrhizobium sp. TaxID=199684 RepID=UPI0035C95A21
MPIIRYVCLVGSLLLGMLFLLADQDKPPNSLTPDRWTVMDSLRAMAHLGEPVQGRLGPQHFIRSETVKPDPVAEITDRERPAMMNAQASMDPPKTARPSIAAKPRKQKLATRQARVRTAAAENAQRVPFDSFRRPYW